MAPPYCGICWSWAGSLRQVATARRVARTSEARVVPPEVRAARDSRGYLERQAQAEPTVLREAPEQASRRVLEGAPAWREPAARRETVEQAAAPRSRPGDASRPAG